MSKINNLIEFYLNNKSKLCKKFPAVNKFLCPVYELVYADNKNFEIDSKKNIIVIPPNDYEILKVNINVKSEKEAIKYAPGLFNLETEYNYIAQKIDDSNFIIVAYDPEFISKKYENLFKENVKQKITFAQFVFSESEEPIHIENEDFLIVQEKIVVNMNSSYIHKKNIISINKALATPNNNYKIIDLETIFNKEVSPKTLKITISILSVILINIFIDIIQTNKNIEEIQKQNEELISSSNLPETSIERSSIIESFQKKVDKQIEFRNNMFEIKEIPVKSIVSSSEDLLKPVDLAVNLPKPVNSQSSGIDMNSISANNINIFDLPPVNTVNLPLKDNSVSDTIKREELNNMINGGTQITNKYKNIYKEGIRELMYDGKSIKITIDTKEAENLKKTFLKKFKNANANINNNRLEIQIQ